MARKPPNTPTPAQIRERAEAIQALWSESERLLRAVAMPNQAGPTPEAVDRLALRVPCYHVVDGPQGFEATPAELPPILPDGRGGERGPPEGEAE